MMKLADLGELQLIERLTKRFSARPPGLKLGIGDDAASAKLPQGQTLFTTDMMIEGVHFDLRWTTLFQLGFKLVSSNVSDIFAMGGKPLYLLLNFSAPAAFSITHFDRLIDGIEAASLKYKVSLIGGDMSSSGKIMLSATVVGTANRIISRSGASPGEFIHITGYPGEAAAGLLIMKNLRRTIALENNEVPKTILPWETIEPLVRRHLMPEAVDPSKFVRHATAMMDVSDGLLIDLERLCRASGCGARILSEKIPFSGRIRTVSGLLKADPLELALSGGEDYELLFTSVRETIPGATCIGETVKSGISVEDTDGRPLKCKARGYEHFVL